MERIVEKTMKCPHCNKPIPMSLFTKELGKKTSTRKAISSRANGRLGGRPKGSGKKLKGRKKQEKRELKQKAVVDALLNDLRFKER